MPLALSRTQDDKGRVRWTLFGASEDGPGRAFWRGFFVAPRRELPAEWAIGFLRRLLAAAYQEPLGRLGDLRRAGLRIYSSPDYALLPQWDEGPLPRWSEPYRWQPGQSLRGVRWLLTFCPLTRLPAAVRRAYSAGELHLLPFPGSLALFGAPAYLKMQRELPQAVQIPLLHSLQRHEAPWGIRIPQSGWMHEARPGVLPHPDFGPIRGGYQRTHRWARVYRHHDELAEIAPSEDKLAHVLFSPAPANVGLYGKPMARNSQIWTQDFRLLLDGPRAGAAELKQAADRLAAGGLFGYRMFYPPMQVGRSEIFWRRPLVAYFAAETGEPTVLADSPLGSLTAHRLRRRSARPLELWPRLLARPDHQEAVRLLVDHGEPHHHRGMINARMLLETWELLGQKPLPRELARQCFLSKEESLDDCSQRCPDQASHGRTRNSWRRGLAAASPPPSLARRGRPPRSPSPIRRGGCSRRPIGRRSPCWPRGVTRTKTTPTASRTG